MLVNETRIRHVYSPLCLLTAVSPAPGKHNSPVWRPHLHPPQRLRANYCDARCPGCFQSHVLVFMGNGLLLHPPELRITWQCPPPTHTHPPFTPHRPSHFHRDTGQDCPRKDKAGWGGVAFHVRSQPCVFCGFLSFFTLFLALLLCEARSTV